MGIFHTPLDLGFLKNWGDFTTDKSPPESRR